MVERSQSVHLFILLKLSNNVEKSSPCDKHCDELTKVGDDENLLEADKDGVKAGECNTWSTKVDDDEVETGLTASQAQKNQEKMRKQTQLRRTS